MGPLRERASPAEDCSNLSVAMPLARRAQTKAIHVMVGLCVEAKVCRLVRQIPESCNERLNEAAIHTSGWTHSRNSSEVMPGLYTDANSRRTVLTSSDSMRRPISMRRSDRSRRNVLGHPNSVEGVRFSFGSAKAVGNHEWTRREEPQPKECGEVLVRRK